MTVLFISPESTSSITHGITECTGTMKYKSQHHIVDIEKHLNDLIHTD